MLKQFALLGSVTAIMIGLGQSSVQAATVIAMDNSDVFYAASRTSLAQAKVDVLSYCNAKGNSGCRVINTSSFTGYGAVAKSVSRNGTAMEFNSQEEANRTALESCRRNMPANETCQLVLQYFDRSAPRPKPICINPATGLRMLSGYCRGVDVGGHPYGTKLNW
jgi:hypothetical protein